MNWGRLALAAVVPIIVALPIAALFWRRKQIDLGNAIAASVFFVSMLVFAGADYAAAVAYRLHCGELAIACPKSYPSDFVKLMGYGFVAFLQVCALYVISIPVDRKIRQNDYAPEWRNGLGM